MDGCHCLLIPWKDGIPKADPCGVLHENHIVFTTKFRRKLLKGGIGRYLCVLVKSIEPAASRNPFYWGKHRRRPYPYSLLHCSKAFDCRCGQDREDQYRPYAEKEVSFSCSRVLGYRNNLVGRLLCVYRGYHGDNHTKIYWNAGKRRQWPSAACIVMMPRTEARGDLLSPRKRGSKELFSL